ncbi:EDD domain protein, DegV family [uncultured Desulfobacterium sp.]|uniref:EDD domain protein, DegV family n=1 Tax=uncultured Desulfobacterium sp. TaxID=201089 RepID=A0A445N344_9BACT|nr:EDD domain protein, DegV family [uncultured Desulfobacterium sp.]
MEQDLQQAFIAGYERLAYWAELLDRINVFPVPDADTGSNLRISLAPLRQFNGNSAQVVEQLLVSAVGNSGNIAARFFSGLLTAKSSKDLPDAARSGRNFAWEAIWEPKPGTMLTVFDELVVGLERGAFDKDTNMLSGLIERLKDAVSATTELLPDLKRAGVVDAGALGMFIYLEGFLRWLFDQRKPFINIHDVFRGRLIISPSYRPEPTNSFCVDTLIRVEGQPTDSFRQISTYGQSVVAFPDRSCLKIHLHTENPIILREQLQSLGEIVEWGDDDIGKQVMNFSLESPVRQALHIMTDAAGSVSRETARSLGMTLLDSYIIIGEKSLPETCADSTQIYSLMKNGKRVSTAQASTSERRQCYQSAVEQHGRVLYLCVGSVFTGNYDAAMAWKDENDPDDRLVVIDSGAASGRLGAVAIATAQYSIGAADAESVISFALQAVARSEEYVFLDRLEYLVAGGRLSKTSGFFGDLLHIKPVISPTTKGTIKVGSTRNSDEQIEFALKQIKRSVSDGSHPFIMLEYSDNFKWVRDKVEGEIRSHYPLADILLQPLSLSSGVHMGPGTWAVAILPGQGY